MEISMGMMSYKLGPIFKRPSILNCICQQNPISDHLLRQKAFGSLRNMRLKIPCIAKALIATSIPDVTKGMCLSTNKEFK